MRRIISCRYFIVGILADSEAEVVRIAGLLRAVQSASQAVSVSRHFCILMTTTDAQQYGLNSVPIFAEVGGVYMNLGFYAVSLLPGWMVVRQIGCELGGRDGRRELHVPPQEHDSEDKEKSTVVTEVAVDV